MPIGVITDACCVVAGGIVGALLSRRVKDDFKDKMTWVSGCCSMAMGVVSIILMENLTAVVFSVMIGTLIGILCRLGRGINGACGLMQRGVQRVFTNQKSNIPQEEYSAMLLTIIVLFCSSGTGIYGSILSGMTGDHSILITKAFLDFITGLVFACSLGLVVSFIAIPQFIIYFILFLLGGVIYPMCSPAMINDFRAAAGFIMLATGFRIAKIKMFPTADMLPSLIIVMPVSFLWVQYILPLVS